MKYTPKEFRPSDIDIEIEACGVCGSDVHTITGGWSDGKLPVDKNPGICAGHEVIGKAVKVGDKVTTVKIGDRVGVGAQIWACLKCPQCKSDNENYCPHQVDTYGANYNEYETGSGGSQTQGGYASHIRANEYFVFPIPDAISTIDAAPMMCAGLTTFSPLYRAKTGPGKHVAIMGIGGLGHFGLLWAKALGAEVTALSHSANKEAEAKKLGADHFVDTSNEKWTEEKAFTYDFILNCADMTHKFDIAGIMGTLKVNGEFHHVGLPDFPLPQFKAQAFAPNGAKMAGSHIGSRPEILAMLKLAADKSLKPIIETIDISEKGCKEAVEKVKTNDVRYRITLTGFDKAFPRK